MSREAIIALASRCEQATGPDRQLDVEIVAAITPGIVGIERGPLDGSGDDYLFVFDPPRAWSESWLLVPRYTGSLDAALTLVPDGHAISLHIDADGTVIAGCMPDDGDGCTDADICASNAPLALCAAALRARAAMETPDA